MKQQAASTRRTSTLLPAGRRLAAGRVRRRHARRRPTRRRTRLMDGAGAQRRRAVDEAVRRPATRSSRSGRCASRGLGATARVPGEPDTWAGWEDSAVPPERARRLPARLPRAARPLRLRRRALRPLRPGLRPHPHRLRPRHAPRASRNYRAFIDEAADLVVALRRLALGRARRRPGARPSCCRRCSAPSWSQAFREFKAIWDPDGKMNPGKVVDPYRIDENLRLGPDYQPAAARDALHVPRRRRQLRAAPRCAASASASAARRDGGTMCPSYMVTREEKHSTRGRARLLFEMLQGEPLERRLARASTVKEALDLCLACKGCKSECPVQRRHGDLQGRVPLPLLRGPAAAAARLRHGPDPLVGAAGVARARRWRTSSRRRRRCGDVVKRLGGIAPQRRAAARSRRETFTRLVPRARPPRNAGRPRGAPLARHVQQPLPPRDRQAAVEVLEAAGLPGRRPAGAALLRPAALRLRHARHAPSACCAQILDALRPRDRGRHAGRRPGAELRGRVPRRADRTSSPTTRTPSGCAGRRSCSSEFLEQQAPDYRAAAAGAARRSSTATATTRRSCGIDGEERGARRSSGSTSSVLDSGCCGMAGVVRLRGGSTTTSRCRSASACCCPAVRAAAAGHADRRRRLQLPRADRADDRTAGRCTWPRCCRLALESAGDGRATATAGGATDGQETTRTRGRARVAAAVGAGLLVGATLLWARRAGRS